MAYSSVMTGAALPHPSNPLAVARALCRLLGAEAEFAALIEASLERLRIRLNVPESVYRGGTDPVVVTEFARARARLEQFFEAFVAARAEHLLRALGDEQLLLVSEAFDASVFQAALRTFHATQRQFATLDQPLIQRMMDCLLFEAPAAERVPQ